MLMLQQVLLKWLWSCLHSFPTLTERSYFPCQCWQPGRLALSRLRFLLTCMLSHVCCLVVTVSAFMVYTRGNAPSDSCSGLSVAEAVEPVLSKVCCHLKHQNRLILAHSALTLT